jgi:hypothetical protein
MKRPTNRLIAIGISALIVLSSVFFYYGVVGPQKEGITSATNPLSIFFGWQWLYLLLASIILAIRAFRKHNRRLIKAAMIVVVSLLLVGIPAFVVWQTRYFVKGEGPSGPEFDCLIWDRDPIPKFLPHTLYYDSKDNLCIVMSIPSFNRFLIDRKANAYHDGPRVYYYSMLLINEIVLIGGVTAARKYYYKNHVPKS